MLKKLDFGSRKMDTSDWSADFIFSTKECLEKVALFCQNERQIKKEEEKSKVIPVSV